MRLSLAFRPLLCGVITVVLTGCAVQRDRVEAGQPERAADAAWVQADADGGWTARALTHAASCPVLRWRGGEQAMRTRAEPAQLARRNAAGSEAKAAVFKLRSCEVALPAGAQAPHAGDAPLPQPQAELRRIVLIGDTGCRMKGTEHAFQDCNTPSRWPFAEVARRAAAMKPDLVLHLGDIHYRESPCPAGNAGCEGSPWGYGDDAWQADFFVPAAPLLAAAPWVFVRGNHETCARAGAGWFRYFDATGFQAARSCADPRLDRDADFSEPFTVRLDAATQLIVFDSSSVSGRAYRPGDASFERYAAQLDRVQTLASTLPHSLFANHHPVLGFGGSDDGVPKPGNAGLASVMSATQPARLLPAGIDLVLSGHVHLFEALSFAGAYPAALVLGNSGSQMVGHVDPLRTPGAEPVPGAAVRSFATQGGFGFATLDRNGAGWQLTEWNLAGEALLRCRIEATRIDCAAAS